MTTLLKNNWMIISVVVLATLSLVLLGLQKASAQPSSIFFESTAVTTTTIQYVGNGLATSTTQVDSNLFSSGKIPNMQTVDSQTLYFQTAASSTATAYTITPQYSNNNIDWYNLVSQGTASAAGAIAVSTTTGFTWTPGTTATTSMVFKLPDVPTEHERIVVSALGGGGAFYMEFDLKKNPSTP